MMPRSGTAVAGRGRPARCLASALRRMAATLLRMPVGAMRRAVSSIGPAMPAHGLAAGRSGARPPIAHRTANAPGYHRWREDPPDIAAPAPIMTRLMISPFFTPLRRGSGAGRVRKKQARQDALGMRNAFAPPRRRGAISGPSHSRVPPRPPAPRPTLGITLSWPRELIGKRERHGPLPAHRCGCSDIVHCSTKSIGLDLFCLPRACIDPIPVHNRMLNTAIVACSRCHTATRGPI